ncbi:MAG TPA: hypothetical protein VNE41_11770 [Chitinophagaceae bacterium]|nr:hypothetical protein [Chitinophagaceae bacterium]
MKRLIIVGTLLSAAVIGVSAFAGVPHVMNASKYQTTTAQDTIPHGQMDKSGNPNWHKSSDTSMKRDSI